MDTFYTLLAQGAGKLHEVKFEGSEKKIKNVAEPTINIGKKGPTPIFFTTQTLTFCTFAAL